MQVLSKYVSKNHQPHHFQIQKKIYIFNSDPHLLKTILKQVLLFPSSSTTSSGILVVALHDSRSFSISPECCRARSTLVINIEHFMNALLNCFCVFLNTCRSVSPPGPISCQECTPSFRYLIPYVLQVVTSQWFVTFFQHFTY